MEALLIRQWDDIKKCIFVYYNNSAFYKTMITFWNYKLILMTYVLKESNPRNLLMY